MTKRFHVSKTACVTFGPPSTKIGQIVDVTMEGLTFHYLAVEDTQDNASLLNILLPQHGFSLRDIPFRIVSDQHAEGTASNGTAVRRCEVVFGELTDAQKAQLERLIEQHTEGPVGT